MILEPKVMWGITREMDTTESGDDVEKLVDFYNLHRLNGNTAIILPSYWASTVLAHMEKMVDSFPQMRFGSVLEVKNRLRVVTIPSHVKVDTMKVILYNEIDNLILNVVDELLTREKRPFFLSS
jgi:hypothetical protein